MIHKIFNKENLLLFFAIILGSTFLLSTLGKYFDLESFKTSIEPYGLPSFMVYIILSIEFFFSICFMLLFLLKRTSALTLVFLTLMTFIFAIGHYYFNIRSCDCFGFIDFLNPDNFILFILKNVLLILISIYIYKNYSLIKANVWSKRTVTLLVSLIISFLAIKYNEYYIDHFSETRNGLSLQDLEINNSETENSEYLFVFSPSCIHCIKAIPKINSLNKRYSLNLTGITINSTEAELEKLHSELNINFNIIKIDKKIFNKLTKIVPIIYKIKNDTIQYGFKPGKLLPDIIFSENVNIITHLPY